MTFRPEKWAPLCALLALAPACKHTGDYVWVDDLPQGQQAADKEYIIQSGDTISVRVWNQEACRRRPACARTGRSRSPS